uniref:Uncharacterized protein n=1 Tax=Pristionchus pacificus TaxID=54126 RepID=A0A8R1YV66_PRIPA
MPCTVPMNRKDGTASSAPVGHSSLFTPLNAVTSLSLISLSLPLPPFIKFDNNPLPPIHIDSMLTIILRTNETEMIEKIIEPVQGESQHQSIHSRNDEPDLPIPVLCSM